MMRKDENAWCVYHKLCGHHTEDSHQLKREIKILIQRGSLWAYVKDVRGQPGKRSPYKGDISLENPLQKKGKNTKEAREVRASLIP